MRRILAMLLATSLVAVTPVVTDVEPAASAAAVRTFATAPDVIVNDVAYDDVTGRAYLVVPSYDSEFGNRLVAFNPANGAVLGSVFVGSEPSVVAVSTDGSVVWVGLDGAGAIVQVDAASLTVTRTVRLRPGYESSRYAHDLAPIPGDPDAVAVSTRRKHSSPPHAGVVLVADGTVAPDQTLHHTGADVIEAVSATELVGYTTQSTSFGFWRLGLDVDGVTVISEQRKAIHNAADITYDGGIVYASNGEAIDAETGAAVGTFAAQSPAPPVVHDGRVYFLSGDELKVFSAATAAVDGPAIQLPSGDGSRMVLTDAGWLVWGRPHFAGLLFVTPTVAVDGPVVAGGGVRSFAATPDIAVTDAVYDAARNRVYAAVAGADPNHANQLVSFDPTDGRILASVFVGSEPGLVALSADGSRIWVTLEEANSLVEVDRDSFTVTTSVSLRGVAAEELRVTALTPIPSSPDAVVIALEETEFRRTRGVAVVEAGALLPDIDDLAYGTGTLAAISSTRVVGFNNRNSGSDFYRFDVSMSGVALAGPPLSTAIRGSDVSIAVFDGRVYASNGVVIDPGTGDDLGSFDFEWAYSVAPVVADGFAYFARGSAVEIFDAATFLPQGESLGLTADADGLLMTDAGLIAWGLTGFAAPQPPVGSLFGVVLDDISGEPIADLCVSAYEAGDFTLTVVATTTTTAVGHWALGLPVGNYWLMYHDCRFFDYFSQWHGGAVPADLGGAAVVPVYEDTPNSDLRAELRALFTDVPRDAFYFLPTVFLWHAGITNGCGVLVYCPDESVTREQMAAFMARFWRLFGPCAEVPSPFGDVSPASFAYWDVGCIADLGVSQGTGPGTYSPGDVVTREQMGAFIARLWRAFGFECPTGEMPFGDVAATSFAHDDILCIYLLGITTGTSATTYSPGDGVTRAQMAAFLERLFDAVTTRLIQLQPASLDSAPYAVHPRLAIEMPISASSRD